MDLAAAFIIFLLAMIFSIVRGISLVYALLTGLVAFTLLGMHRNFPLRDLTKMALGGARESLVVVEVMGVIGFLTAAWRVSGTITIFVYYGIQFITPPLFLIIAFLLSCVLSYAIGTSFGVAGTVGVIFMTLARSGGVDPILTAGVLMSGVYFGDRGSPVSSSATLVAGVTQTKIYDNVKLMMRQCVVPFAVTLAIYAVLSFRNPISHVDQDLVQMFESSFQLSLWAFVPALIMLVLPLFRVDVMKAMGLSIGCSVLIAWLVQGVPLLTVVRTCILGYEAQGSGLGSILNGGGFVSMVEIMIILVISCMYSGIFEGTKMLESVQKQMEEACSRFGRFFVMILLSFFSAMIFCNQTIATLMCQNLLEKPYLDGGGSREELALDMENSVILISCMIPWCIGCSVPLAFFGVDVRAMPFAFYMYLVPIYYLAAKKRWFPNRPVVSVK